jgi:pimeloyl-ACP methyl ester carboxylesterase
MTAKISDPSGPASRIYFSQRLRLRYVDWGNPGAPPLLLVHGGRDHCRNWDWVAAALRHEWHILAPDLRGHGDSQWSRSGNYSMAAYLYDLAQLIHQQELAPVSILAHSLGGMIALRYAGIYPDNVRRLIAIEGLGAMPRPMVERARRPIAERMQRWIAEQRALSGRLPRRYPTLEDAFRRMQEANRHLSAEQALHLTQHGVNQNEDGTYSWKFDNYVRAEPPYGMTREDVEALWGQIACPTLLVYGKESWASNPEADGRIRHFKHARVVSFDNAGHWVHHDRLDAFLDLARDFLRGDQAKKSARGA